MFRQVTVMVVLLCASEAFAAAPPTSGRDCHGDPLPPGAVMRLGTRHGRYALTWSDRVQLFFSPDGKELLTHADHRYKSWDVATRRETAWGRKLPGDMAIQLLPDGKTLVTASLERSKRSEFGARWVLRRWRWGKEEPLGEVEIELESDLERLNERPGVAAFSDDGKYLLSWGHSAPVVIWDAEKGKRLHDLGQKVRAGFPVTFTPDGKKLGSVWKWS